ncbi:hypothetical protein [Roseivirga seohaensis]
MNRKHILLFLLLYSPMLFAQEVRVLNPITWPESDKDTATYTVKGERHGVSFF